MQMLSGAGADGTGGLQRLHSAFLQKITQYKPAQTSQRASALPTQANSTEEKRTNTRTLQAHLEISEAAPVPVVCESSLTWKWLETVQDSQSQWLLQDWRDQEIISLLFVWVFSETVLAGPLTPSQNPNTEMKWNVKQLHLWSHSYLSKLYCKNFTFYIILFCSSFELFTHPSTASIYNSCFSIHSLPSNPHYNSFPSIFETCYFSLNILP